MRKPIYSPFAALAFLAVSITLVRPVRGQELSPILENGRPAIQFGDHKQCFSTISYEPGTNQLRVPVLHWGAGKVEEVGILSSTPTSIEYRAGSGRSFAVPRPMVISIDNGIYFLTITKGEKKNQQFTLTCNTKPDAFMYVSMLMNDFGAGIAIFNKLIGESPPPSMSPADTKPASAGADTNVPESKAASGPKVISWREGSPESDLIVVEGSWVHILFNDDVVVAVAISQNEGYYVADLSVFNNRKSRVLVDPSVSRLTIIEKSAKTQTLLPMPPEKIAKKIQRRTMWANVLRAFAAGMARKQITSTSETTGTVSVFGSGGSAQGVYSGTTSTTTTVPDTEAQRNAAIANARASEDASARAEGIIRSAMKANTLFPNNTREGVVYFERKKSDQATFRIRIEETVYEFSFSLASKQ